MTAHITLKTVEEFNREYDAIKVAVEKGNYIHLYLAEEVFMADGVFHKLSSLGETVTLSKLENKEDDVVETVEGVVEDVVSEEEKQKEEDGQYLRNRIKTLFFGHFKSEENKEGDNKEEKEMKFNIKDNKLVQGIKKAATGMWAFVKKHAVKATAGLAAVAVAGTFTTGLGMATLVGAAIYTVGDYVFNAVIKKDASVFSSLVQSALYTTVGAYLAYSLFYAVALAGLYVSDYTAIAFVYTQYFILA